jgi:hypothetical protein
LLLILQNNDAMKLKLIQTGGVAGKTMAAQVNCKMKDEELDALVAIIQKKATRGRARDAHSYVLQKDGDEKSNISISIDAIPPEHTALFQKLFNGLKAVD